MKTKNLFTITFLTLIIIGFSTYVKSQNCNIYYSLANGNEYEMTNYDSNNNVNGKTINKISNVISNTEGIMATVKTTTKDIKDEVVANTGFSVKCIGDKMYIEMKNFIPLESLVQMNNMSVKSDAKCLEFPENLSVGATLNDASSTISLYSGSDLFTTIKITITNRKVVSKESITTTAGTFNCFKITQDFNMETTTKGVTIPVSIKSAEYYAAGAGSVKTESYNKDGKLMGYSLLTKITKL